MAKRKKVTQEDLDSWVISENNIDEYASYLSDWEDDSEGNPLIRVAEKTVNTFSGLMGRKLDLRNHASGCTDGETIYAPFQDSNFYEIVEHEIAHCLFNSDVATAEVFIYEYSNSIVKTLRTFEVTLDDEAKDQLRATLMFLLNLVEDHRINSLWGKLYPGSYKKIFDLGNSRVKRYRKEAHNDLKSFALCVAYDVTIPNGRYERFAPAILSALKRVENKGPAATYAVTKRLLADLITEVIRLEKGAPPTAKPNSGARVQTDLDKAMAALQKGAGNDNQDAGDNADQQSDKDDSQGISSTTPEERAEAIQKLVANLGDSDKSRMRKQISRITSASTDLSHRSSPDTETIRKAASLNSNNDEALEEFLEESAQEAAAQLEDIEKELHRQQELNEKQWSSRGAGPVDFVDVAEKSVRNLSPYKQMTTSKLRHLFQQVKSRKEATLEDNGFEVDVQAYVSNKTSGRNDPVFKADRTGRGMKVLLLVDRSSSMEGHADQQVADAVTMLQGAVEGDSRIDLEVWGFAGMYPHTRLYRIKHGVKTDLVVNAPARGNTPMLEAITCAVNSLQTGSQKKHLVVLTDGAPNGSTGGQCVYKSIRKEVNRARRSGVETSALIIGSAFAKEKAAQMFGNKQSWKFVDEGYYWEKQKSERELSNAVVDLVRDSFLRFAKCA